MIITEQPLVSVIVPVYNVESYLTDCLDSIKQQTYRNLEVIIVEDCSTDSSRQTLEPHLIDKRIKVIQHKKNSGLSAARNTGIKSATGEYMMFVDSDDIIDNHLVATCIDCSLEKNADVVTYGFIPFKDGLTKAELPHLSNDLDLKPIVLGNAYFNLSHFAWLKFIRSSIVKSVLLEFPVGLHYEDWPFHWHLGLSTEVRYQLPADLYLYRQRDASITGSKGKELLDLFVIHSKVNKLLQHNKDSEIREIFTTKVNQSHWNILTRIESKYLETALREAKKAEKLFKLKKYKSNTNFKGNITSKIISMPDSIALFSLKILRGALHRRAQFRIKQSSKNIL